MCAILNSRLASFYHFNSSPKATKGAFPKILITDIENFPIKIPQSQIQFVSIVDQIMSIKKSNPQSDTTILEQQIDNLVYKLYDLTYDEVKVVDPDFGLTEEEYAAIKTD